MGIDEKEFKQKIWYYYLMLEEDFLSTKNIVHIDKIIFRFLGCVILISLRLVVEK